jgi:hypothetical protein
LNQICFGMVDRYVVARGFGFVRNDLPGERWGSYFFHITTLEKACPDLAISLEGGAAVGFWYRLEDTPKGKRALPLSLEELHANPASSLPLATQIEALWEGSDTPLWLEAVTRDFFGEERASELIRHREEAEANRKKLQAQELAARLAKKAAEQAERDARKRAEDEKLEAQRRAEEAEFDALVAEIRPLGFSHSSQVSKYIVQNSLGNKYKKISGYLTMESGEEKWEFKGGFPPTIYARLCEALNLNNYHSGARATQFESFEERKMRMVGPVGS